MEDQKREFKGIWIPALVYLNREVSWNAKVIWLEIDSFTSRGNECFFSNEYLADLLHCSVASVTRYLNEVKDVGWVEEVSFNGRKRYLRSLLDSSNLRRQDNQKRGVSPLKNAIHKKLKDNVPSIYPEANASLFPNNASENKILEPSIESEKKEGPTLHARIIDVWLNEIHPGWKFRGPVDGKAVKELIEQMRTYSKKKNEVEPNDDRLVDFFRHYCKSLPEFYKSETLMVLNVKFDSIIDKIKKNETGQNSYPRKQTSAEYINSFRTHG